MADTCGPRKDGAYFVVHEGTKTKLFVEFHNFCIHCKAKSPIDWTMLPNYRLQMSKDLWEPL